jgi:hypothetical protein
LFFSGMTDPLLPVRDDPTLDVSIHHPPPL